MPEVTARMAIESNTCDSRMRGTAYAGGETRSTWDSARQTSSGASLLDTRSIEGLRGQHKPIEKSYNGLRQEGVAAQVKEVIREAGLLVWSKWGALGAGKNRRLTLARGFMANEPRLAMLA